MIETASLKQQLANERLINEYLTKKVAKLSARVAELQRTTLDMSSLSKRQRTVLIEITMTWINYKRLIDERNRITGNHPTGDILE